MGPSSRPEAGDIRLESGRVTGYALPTPIWASPAWRSQQGLWGARIRFRLQIRRFAVSLLRRSRFAHPTGARFQFLDRWSETAQELTRSREALEGGLWRFVVDLSRSGQWTEADAERLGDTGRLVFSRHARREVNPAPAAAASSTEGVLARLVRAAEEHDDAARQSMVFDLQRLVAPSSWHTIEMVVGAAWEHNLADSPMLRDTPPGEGDAALFELWDPFLGALKHTAVHLSLLPHVWACDLDLLAGTQEHYLGLD